MTDSHIGAIAQQRNIVEYLKSLRLQPGDLDVTVKGGKRSGVLYLKQGQVIGAKCGELRGNGALLTLTALGTGEVCGGQSEKTAPKNVSITLGQIERFFAKLPSLPQRDGHCDEEQLLQQAIRFFFQFRRKEARGKLVEVLRSNRFYYPAWLWHSRLMTREENIKKALSEAGKWGNSDPAVKREAEKISPQLTGSTDTVKRCLFCWSLLQAGQESCGNCYGLQRVAKVDNDGKQATEELQQSLSVYEAELLKDPGNLRIIYCLCLGFYSLGKRDKARAFIDSALKISPREPLFIRASAMLQSGRHVVSRESLPKAALQQKSSEKMESVPGRVSAAEKEKTTTGTVLVVEDSKTARKVISLVLGRKGYRIIEAASGTQALLAVEGVIPDLVLLDVMLPDMTGYEVLSAIRKNSELAEVPVVMLTGKRGAADRQKGMISGANEYLTKPFNPAKLLSVLGRYLGPLATTVPVPQQPAHSAHKRQLPSPAVKAAAEVKPAVVKPAVTGSTTAPPALVRPEKKKSLDKSVLVIEDSPTSRKVISMVLSRKGYTVNEAANGYEALRMVADAPPHLILLDAMLPDMSGYDILLILKQDRLLNTIPVVMLTAKDSAVDREKGMRAGSAAYLTKPFNPDKLLSVVGSYM